jgi:hypothetical protein
MTTGGARTVVLVDHTRWGTFSQLSAFVRRSGFRTIRVTTSPDSWYNGVVDRLLFDRVIHVDAAGLKDVGSLLEGESVVDFQCTEYVTEDLAKGDLVGLPDAVARQLRLRGVLLDKAVVGELSIERGIRVPAKVSAEKIDPQDAVRRLGLPLVVKAKVGAGGDRVRIVGTQAELDAALIELDSDPTELFYEQYIDGEYIDYSAIVGPTGPVQEVATRSVDGTIYPPSSIEIVDEPELLTFGRHIVEKLEFTGIVHMDTVKDSDGRYWLLDLNLRCWGSMFSCRRAGVDFGAGYLYATGLSTDMPTAVTGHPGTLTVFPGIVDDKVREGKLVGTAVSFFRFSPGFIRPLGVKYWLAQLAATAVGLLGSRATLKAARRAKG